MDITIRPSSDLRNHYSDISRQCRESNETVVITVNGKGDTAVMGFQAYKNMRAELELLRTLAESEEDVIRGRVAPIQETFQDIRTALLERKDV